MINLCSKRNKTSIQLIYAHVFYIIMSAASHSTKSRENEIFWKKVLLLRKLFWHFNKLTLKIKVKCIRQLE